LVGQNKHVIQNRT